MTFKCDNCGGIDLEKVYTPPDTLRGLSVYICQSCALVQSLPRIDHVTDRTRRITSGAGWGNVRYGKGFRTSISLDRIESVIDLKSVGVAIDIGANRGSFVKELSLRAPKAEIVALEPDNSVVDAYDHEASISLINERVENFKFPSAKYDLVYCSHTIEHLSAPLQVLSNLRQAVSPKSICFFEVPNLDIIGKDDLLEEFFIDKHLFHYSTKCFIDLLGRAGFEVLDGGLFIDDENISVLCKPCEAAESHNDADSPQVIKSLINDYAETISANQSALAAATAKIEHLAASKKVVFWGAGRIFDSFVHYGGLNPLKLGMLVDKYLHGLQAEMHGLKISLPGDIVALEPDVIVIASRTYKKEIESEIKELGVSCSIVGFDELLAEDQPVV